MLDEIVVGQGHPLQLQRDVEHRAATGHRQDVIGHLLDDLGSGVEILVDAVSEAHQPHLAGADAFHVFGDTADRPNLLEHPKHLLVGAPVKGAVERRGGRGRRAEGIGM